MPHDHRNRRKGRGHGALCAAGVFLDIGGRLKFVYRIYEAGQSLGCVSVLWWYSMSVTTGAVVMVMIMAWKDARWENRSVITEIEGLGVDTVRCVRILSWHGRTLWESRTVPPPHALKFVL